MEAGRRRKQRKVAQGYAEASAGVEVSSGNGEGLQCGIRTGKMKGSRP